jgi:type 1 glutamine amidotransferase
MKHALIFSGGADYADPWHPYAESSEHLAETIRARDIDVEVTDSVDVALSALADRPDLFAINAGAGRDPHPRDDELADAALAHLHRGAGLLVMHLATSLFPASPEWERAIGARWIWDTSHHPPYGRLHVDVARGLDITEGVDDFDIVDEAYSGLRLGEGSRVLASHELDGERHPLLWLRTVGTGSVVVDLLGHDATSYDSSEHRELLGRAAGWAA